MSSLARSWPPAGGADGVDVADDVGDGHVGSRELLHVALRRTQPFDRGLVTALREEVAGVLAQGVERVVVDLRAGHAGNERVEQGGEAAQEPALGLAAQAEEDHVVAGEHGVRDQRNHGVLVAEHAGEELLSRLELTDEVSAHLLLDARLASHDSALLQLAKGPRGGHSFLLFHYRGRDPRPRAWTRYLELRGPWG